jgi:hypothetical protein
VKKKKHRDLSWQQEEVLHEQSSATHHFGSARVDSAQAVETHRSDSDDDNDMKPAALPRIVETKPVASSPAESSRDLLAETPAKCRDLLAETPADSRNVLAETTDDDSHTNDE